jgi:phospholipase C
MTMSTRIKNVFVLMLENRSFDHMLGFSGITGTDAVTGQKTQLNGLTGTESNSYQGVTYTVAPNANRVMPVGPGHEFLDAVEQLCGPGASYQAGSVYPEINNSGFVANYAASPSPGEGNAHGDLGEILRGYSPDQLPVLNALARNFAVCDNWFSSLPGPTLPNRYFLYGASSGGLDNSPSSPEMLEWEYASGFKLPNGSIFDALKKRLPHSAYRIYTGCWLSMVGTLHGITGFDIHSFDHFEKEVAAKDYPWAFTLIEPDYGDIVGNTFTRGTSQHPLDDVAGGEKLIKQVYEAIRNSPHWETSLLIVTWDEHGGFYDHVTPPRAVAPGDNAGSKHNKYGFTFEQYGVRVPAVVISPLIPANVIDHRLYDHASVPATLEKLFGLAPLTQRDANANDVTPLLSLSTPRTDAPLRLPDPAPRDQTSEDQLRLNFQRGESGADQTVDIGKLPGFLHIAAKHDLELSSPEQRQAITARVAAIRTRKQAQQYMAEVEAKLRAMQVSRSATQDAGKTGAT